MVLRDAVVADLLAQTRAGALEWRAVGWAGGAPVGWASGRMDVCFLLLVAGPVPSLRAHVSGAWRSVVVGEALRPLVQVVGSLAAEGIAGQGLQG